ncbi:sensor histidine kinase [Nocardioides okcheonensis]|uniref:sensor histidine kinase n=1 Tax=Nocardioides okcheonensis TaxID=2894081 RepID=UPI001E4FDF9E|nr:histidine kinase [Nocardioides okcheonensis]UFN46722.1 histidine kinase [Nocardioides okcheonensis]
MRGRTTRPTAASVALGSAPPSGVLRRALVRFTVSAVLAVVVLSLTTLLVADQIARHRALEDGRRQAANLANRLAAPMVDEAVRAGEPGAADLLDTVMDNRMRDGSLQRVKIWDQDGRIIWDDTGDLVGRTFEMEPQLAALFGTHEAWAEVSDLDRAENVTEQSVDEMLEVYAGATDADGRPVVVESYLTTADMHEHAQEIARSFVPLVLGTLLVFLLVVLPLAYSLARRVERAQAERTVLVQHALEAADLERRRIAHDLHDGVIQDLSGVGYLIPTVRKELRSDGDLDRARTMLDRAGTVLRGDVASLRTMMTDLYPPDLEGEGFGDALRELAAIDGATAGLAVEVAVPPGLLLPPQTARLAYRVTREGVRNVVKHARATHLWVDVSVVASTLEVRVRDDGTGATTHGTTHSTTHGTAHRTANGTATIPSRDGHLGLRLLADAVADAGGRLDLEIGGAYGTVLTARLPLPGAG